MTIEQLMIPRVMCKGNKKGEAIWPFSPYLDGMVLELDDTDYYHLPGYKLVRPIAKCLTDEHPHLFRPMPWYEGRKPEEMPTYLKSKNNERVVKVYDYNCTIMCFRISYATSYTSLSLFIPATEADFIAYQNSKKQ